MAPASKQRNIPVSLLMGVIAVITVLFAQFLLTPGFPQSQTYTGGDAGGYLEAGKLLWLEFQLHSFRTFGYPVLTGIPFLFGASEQSARVFLVLVNTGIFAYSAILLYNIASGYLKNTRISVAISLIYIFSPGLLFINFATLSEPFFILCLLLAVKFLIRFAKERNSNDIVFTAFWVVFSATVRPINLHFAVIILVIIVGILIIHTKSVTRTLIVAVFSVIMIIIPMLIMKKTYGVFTYTNNSKYMLYHYLGSYASSIPQSSQIAMYDSFHRNALRVDSTGFREGEMITDKARWKRRDSFYSASLKNILAARKKQLLVAIFNNCIENATTESHFIKPSDFKSGYRPVGEILQSISKLQNALFSILAFLLITISCIRFIYLMIRNQFSWVETPVMYAVFQTSILIVLSSLSFWQGDRFSIVFYPLILFLMAYYTDKYIFKYKK